MPTEAALTGAPGAALRPDAVTVWGPASLSNLGPGFDALGLCLDAIGDRVEAWPTAAPGVHITFDTATPSTVPIEPRHNTAAVAAQAVLDRLRPDHGLGLRIHKGYTPGSGLGSSAASAVAGAWAANVVCGTPLAKADLVAAVLDGEQVASGARHGDNVLPALFGGLVLVSPTDPQRYRQIRLRQALPLVVIQPNIQVLTRQARINLPQMVPLRDAANNAAELAFLIDAFRAADWEAVGRCIMADRLVEPVRAALVPCFAAVRAAALEAGATGCALTGSGPAMFAVVPTPEALDAVRAAMLAAVYAAGLEAVAFLTEADAQGVRTLR